MRAIRRRHEARLTALWALAALGAPLWISCGGGDHDPTRLARQVEIRRTAYGVPHIKGKSLRAVAFGFGYTQAEDHLLNIMKSMLRARGELALHFGPGEGGANVESDFLHRRYRVWQRAEATYDRLDDDFRDMLEGFALGLNYYVDGHREGLPPWVPTLSAHDVAAHGLAGVMRFAFNRGRIVDRFLAQQKHPDKRRASLEEPSAESPETSIGSNMWALAPSRTASGKAILLGNPHQPWSPVATYYEAHLTVPGELDFYGSTFVGRPVLTTGFNANLGWSHTVNYPDLEEIYALERSATDPNSYVIDGAPVAMTSETVSVEVKGGAPQTRTFWHTPLGPVIHLTEDEVFILKSASYDEFRFYQQWLRLAQAEDLDSFRKALDPPVIPMFNITYADREGNIFYLWNGTVPELPHDSNTIQPVRARKSSEMWSQFHAIEELPQLLNPPGGYVQNCNDPPYYTNLHATLDAANFPPYFPAPRLGLRSQHSLDMIHNYEKLSLEQVRDLKFSPRMLLAERLRDDLANAVDFSGPSREAVHAAKLLRQWDLTVKPESRGSVLFATWWQRYSRVRGRARPQNQLFAEPWSPEHPTETPKGLADRKRAVDAFVWALGETTIRYGGWNVTWGDAHRIRLGAVDLPASGCGGRLGCFRVLDWRSDIDGRLVARGGDSWVFAVEFGDSPRAYTIVAYSQSEVEGSPHRTDQTELFARGEMKSAAFTDDEIEAQLLRRYHPGEEDS